MNDLFDHKPSQAQMILAHLERGQSLTVAEALSKYGIYALSQRCSELKRKGFKIKSIMVKSGDKHYAQYTLEK